MKTTFFLILFFVLGLAFIISSCEKEDEQTKISRNGEDESHNMGLNCLNCHTNGPGEGLFKIAGTLYDSTLVNTVPNGRVEFYDAASGGNLKYTLEVDANGNFYTTENINFGSGLYPKVIAPNGDSKMMNSPFSGGGCAFCHGNTRPRISVN